MKKTILFFLLFLSANLFGQNDSIQKSILNDEGSKSAIIYKGRRLMLDKFLEGDYKEVERITDYLKDEVENNDYASFYKVEYWLILYWTHNYSDLITSVKAFTPTEIYLFQKKIKPEYDKLYEKVRDRSRESRLLLETYINHSELDSIDKDFLLMQLKYLVFDKDYTEITQDTLNTIADNFLNRYPKSDYETFTRSYIRYKQKPSNWGFEFQFFGGYDMFTDSLSAQFTDVTPFGFSYDIYYKRIALYLQVYLGSCKTIKDIGYDSIVWKGGSKAFFFMPEASLGYVLYDKDCFRLAPFVGIAATNIMPVTKDSDKEPALKNAGIDLPTTYNIGLNLDFKIKELTTKSLIERKNNYQFIRLRYTYSMPQYGRKYDGLNGNMHMITIGYGGFGRMIKRDY